MKNHFYRGDLPHWQPAEGTFFITYRLFGSIPKSTIQQFKNALNAALRDIAAEHPLPPEQEMSLLPPEIRCDLERAIRKKEYLAQKRHFKQLDDFLDSNLNEPHWLKQPAIARLVSDSLRYGDGKHYTLWAHCIMSNHVHALLTMLPKAPILWKVLQDSKKFTGRQANKLLGREGKFWEDESYDHLVREESFYEPGEFNRIFWYILNNPVKAGLVRDWSAWPWTYVHPSLVPPNSSSAGKPSPPGDGTHTE